ncbi:MAG: T9SS type A sorting domain-containing protein [Bacteroidales bacterium]|nr:T9SS type A sorting domain-containing protein [Bacteroidales bacterium]
MRNIFLTIVGISIITILNAQNKPERAPLNPEFVKFSKQYDNITDKKSTNENSLGYIPSPLYLNFNQEYLSPVPNSKKSTADLPLRYDLRNLGCVTSVKDQNPLGSCWTFASIGAIESSWLINRHGSFDLSEENMGTCHGFEFGINEGGNNLIAAAYLTRLDGPVLESSDPYSKNIYATCPTESVTIPAYVPTVTWLPKDVNIVKKAIYENGAATASMYTGGNYMNSYMNSMDYTFFYGGTNSPDHAVLIIGWDDEKVIRGGAESPSETIGGWIVKNSWGTEWGLGGYFYVAYEDTRFLSSSAIFPERINLDEVDTLYMEDFLGATSSYGFRHEIGYGLVKYEAPAEHFINKIGTYINSSGTFIDIEIYDDFTGDSLLENLISSSYNNIVKFPGYYTFDIAALVEGDYYIKVKYNTPGYNYPIPAETTISYQGEPYAAPEINQEGFSWISKDAIDWDAMGSDIEYRDADLCIRAYANRNTTLNPFFNANNVLTCVGSEVEFTENSNGDVTNYLWDFGKGASPATADTKGPHKIIYSSPGLKDIFLEISGPDGTKKLEKKSYIEVVEALDVFLPYSEILLVNGKSVALTAIGAENYSWSPAEGLSSTTDNPVIASPTESIVYTVSGTLGNCSGSTTVKINVVNNPPNDDVCEAIEILWGGHLGPYTNINATVEDHEPYPPEGECDEPMHWCVEGGLQNSVWFTFVGSERGIISIDAPGMDTQLALYKADACDSIFSPTGYEMVAAFDDYYDVEPYAAALENVAVIPGERYFLQVDGSAGGVEGYFSFIFWDYPLGIEERNEIFNTENPLNIFPNPSTGIFEITLPGNSEEILNLHIFDALGKMVYYENHVHQPGEAIKLNIENFDNGIYYLSVGNDEKIYHKKLIIQ